MKTSKVISIRMTFVTGVLMLAFQNCGRLNIDVKDLAATANKAGGSATEFVADDVKVQITENNGNVINVVETIPMIDDSGAMTVEVRTDQYVAQDAKDQGNSAHQTSDQTPYSNDNKKDDVVVVQNESDKDCSDKDDKSGSNQGTDVSTNDGSDDDDGHESVSNDGSDDSAIVVDASTGGPSEPINSLAHSCDQFLKINGATLIDLANFDSLDELDVVKGFTVIFSSNANQYIENLTISRGVGRTVICGVKIGNLAEKVGRLDLLDGAEILSIGSEKGKSFDGPVASLNKRKK